MNRYLMLAKVVCVALVITVSFQNCNKNTMLSIQSNSNNSTDGVTPDTDILVNSKSVVRAVPKTVYGEGLLNYVSSDAFVRSLGFQDTVKASNIGSLRWPGAGHSNIPIFHFDNKHTYYSKNGPYSTKRDGNVWDPLYPKSEAGPAEEIVTLGGFVDVVRNTSLTPMMIFTWRSAVLWRDIDGKRL